MSGGVLWVVCPKEGSITANLLLGSLVPRINGVPIRRSKMCSFSSSASKTLPYSSTVVTPARSSEEKVYEVALKQAALVREQKKNNNITLKKEKAIDLNQTVQSTDENTDWDLLNDAYHRCGEVCAEYAKTFYLGTLRMTPERRKAVWAIYVWCRRTDELVDGPNTSHITPKALDRWEQRLSDLFQGQAPESKASTESVYNAALALGIANQLANILRDVGEDARRGRVYIPQDELALAGLSDEDIFQGKVTDKWRSFMKDQIKRARMFLDEAEKGVAELNSASRRPVWASLLLYRQMLDSIEANDYDSFTKRAYVGKTKKNSYPVPWPMPEQLWDPHKTA